jgi:hypothetical protein
LGLAERRTGYISHERRDQGLLHNPVPNPNHPRLGEFTRALHSGEVIQTRRAAFTVPRAFLERTIQDLTEHVQGYVAAMGFNLDEFGIQDANSAFLQEQLSEHKILFGRDLILKSHDRL